MSNSLKAALWTALFTFVAGVLLGALNLLSAFEGWVNGTDPTLMDDLSVFVKVTAAAFVAAASGLINWAVRAVQARGALPGNGPQYVTPPDA